MTRTRIPYRYHTAKLLVSPCLLSQLSSSFLSHTRLERENLNSSSLYSLLLLSPPPPPFSSLIPSSSYSFSPSPCQFVESTESGRLTEKPLRSFSPLHLALQSSRIPSSILTILPIRRLLTQTASPPSLPPGPCPPVPS